MVASLALRSSWRTPNAHAVMEVLAADVRSAHEIVGLPILRYWIPNRLGFNIMHGSVGRPAHIPEHTDVPAEHGLVMAIDLSEGTPHMSIILGRDTCDKLKIPQPVHSLYSTQERVNMTFAELGFRK